MMSCVSLVLVAAVASEGTSSATSTPPPDGLLVPEWCSSNTRCREDGDATAYCDLDHLICSCSDGYGPLNVGGSWKLFGCYVEQRHVYATLEFAQAACTIDRETRTIESRLVSAVEASLSATVTTLSVACGVSTTVFVMTMDVPASKAVSLTSAAFKDIVLQGVKNDAILTFTLGADSVVVDLAVLGSDLPLPPAPFGQTTAPDTPAPPVESGPQPCDLANADRAFYVKIDGTDYCTASQCSTGYITALPSAGNHTLWVCDQSMAPDERPCAVDGHCTFDGKTACVDSKCTLPASPPTKSVSQVRSPTSFLRNFCTTDLGCRTQGDSHATCVTRAVQGNYCACSAGYEYIDPSVPICVAHGATSLSVSWGINFPSAICSEFDASVHASLKAVMVEAFGGIVSDDVVVCGSVSYMGAVNMKKAAAVTYASGSVSLRDQVAGLIKARNDVALNKLGDISSAGLSNGLSCTAHGAVASRLDARERCQALECDTGYDLTLSANVYSCEVSSTPHPTAPHTPPDDDNDDGLSHGAKVGIGLGSAAFLILVVVVVVVVVKKHQKKDEEDDEPIGAFTKRPTEPAS